LQHNLKVQSPGATAAVDDPTANGAADGADDAAARTDRLTQAISDDWSEKHAINIRLTIPLPSTRFFLTIVGGRERRQPDRRADERRKNPLATKRNIVFLSVLGLITGLALFTVIQFATRFVLEKTGAF